LHFQVCIAKEFRYFVMCYRALTCMLQFPSPYFFSAVVIQYWSQWPHRLRRRSTAACLLRSWVWIPPVA
jgi:hypothetical protein